MPITSNSDYLLKTLSKFNLSQDDIDLIMLGNPALEGALDVQACKLAIYNSLSTILPLANISEGGFSVSWDTASLRLWYAALADELGKENVLGNPKIKNKSNLW